MQDLNDLFYYVQVVDHGGFAPAGRALDVPKSKLSRRIALLEARLGVRLIQRSTRQFRVTELGQAYYQHCRAMLIEAEAAQSVIDAAQAELCGALRLACPVALLHARVGAMLVEFARRHPQVNLQIVAMNRPVDVVGEGLDLALRVRPPPLADSGLALRTLGASEQCLVAAPALIARHAPPRRPADLADWPSLGHGPAMERFVWRLEGPAGERETQPHAPRLTATDLLTLRTAAIAGLGVLQAPVMLLREALADGTLAPVLPGWAPPPETIHAIFPTRRGLLPSVRALLDHLAQSFAESFAEPPSPP